MREWAMPKERHQLWVSIPTERREAIVGDCWESVVKRVDVVVDAGTLNNTTLQVDVTCQKYPNGETLHEPLAVFDDLEREERRPLVLIMSRVSLGKLCEGCEFRLDNEK
jgi:hypothetical protein